MGTKYGYQTVGDIVRMFVLKQLNSPAPLYLKLGEVSLERKILPPHTLSHPCLWLKISSAVLLLVGKLGSAPFSQESSPFFF